MSAQEDHQHDDEQRAKRQDPGENAPDPKRPGRPEREEGERSVGDEGEEQGSEPPRGDR